MEIQVKVDVRPHDHDYCEVCFVVAGTGAHLTADYRRPLRRGDVVVVAPGEVHAIEAGRGLKVINLYYLSEWLLRDVRDFWGRGGAFALFFARALFRVTHGPPIPHFSLKADLIERCEAELRDLVEEGLRDPPSAPYLRAAFVKFMIMASPAHNERGGDRFRSEVWRALQVIEGRLNEGEPFSPEEMARGLNLTPGHLARLFKQQTGWPPSDYFQYRRVQNACQALLDGRRSVTEIAIEHGYADASHFGRFFRRFLGLTPRDYRKLYRG